MKEPVYIIEETLLRRNLQLIADVAKEADVEIILAFKAFALWKTFPIFREYINSTTASSLSEARLALEEFGAKAHTYSPAYTDEEIDDIVRCSSHLTFNSLSQYERFNDRVEGKASIGLRVNPECALLFTTVTDSYYHRRQPNRFGVEASSAIFSLAKKYNAAVWDQFSLMGGLGSVEQWAQSGLATWDLVHFTSEGYNLFGNLLFNAIMDRYSELCRR